jgi:5'-nucleotidase
MGAHRDATGVNEPPSILLTNDDGIDSAGLGALRAGLSEFGDVTVVAPAKDRSGVGMSRSWSSGSLEMDDHERGYAVRGTPADCVAVADSALDVEFDVVVSGCNHGPNIGAHILGRSGTVGAAMEAALLGYPAVAVSLYDLGEFPVTGLGHEDFGTAVSATRYVTERFLRADAFHDADYCNVNAPRGDHDDVEMRITRPSRGYELDVDDPGSEGAIELQSQFWRDFLDLEVSDPPGSDRRTAVDGAVSVTPLSVPRGPGLSKSGETVSEYDASEW